MSDLLDRLEIACHRCRTKGKPELREFPDSASTYRRWIELSVPEGWNLVDEKVVCQYCYAGFLEVQRKFMARVT